MFFPFLLANMTGTSTFEKIEMVFTRPMTDSSIYYHTVQSVALAQNPGVRAHLVFHGGVK
jgi:hypothetical protein